MVAKKDVLRVFRGRGLMTNLYLRIKLRICPVLAIETYLPAEGRVIDLGCGSGLMAAIYMLGSDRRRVTGFDLDPEKVAAARRLEERWPSLEFHEADLTAFRPPEAQALTIVDVLYLIPFAAQEEILKWGWESLPSGGVLLLKDMDTRPAWKAIWNSFQETLAVKVLGFTLGGKFYFRPEEDYRRLLERLGFEVQVVRLDRGYWYPHILFVCRKK